MVLETLKRWIAALRQPTGLDLPEGGRSSVEGPLSDRIAGALAGLGTVSPVIDFTMLALLKQLWLTNPDVAQFVANIKHLGNSGHTVVVDAPSAGRAEAAAARLNEAASRIYERGAGVDGLINQYLSQLAWSGALSSEDVVDLAGRRVEQVALVPVEQIRFRFEEGRYVPYQQPGTLAGLSRSPLGLIRLNDNTYRYYAVDTVENSPYAKPPATAAVDAITGPQTDMRDNIKYIAQKLGILGLVSASVTPPPRKPGESEGEYQKRATDYLARVTKALAGNFNKGLLTHFRDQKIEHSNVAADARGAKDVWQINEEQVISGLLGQPAFFGRTDSTTETYADVVYNLLLAMVGNMQRVVKRRQEATYRLDLRLGGVEVDGVSVQFNRAHARDPLKEAQAEASRVDTAIKKAEFGIISPDEAAQELGYESAFDPELLSTQPEAAGSLQRAGSRGAGRAQQSTPVTLRFDRGAQKYKFVPPRYELSAAVEADKHANVIALKKKAA